MTTQISNLPFATSAQITGTKSWIVCQKSETAAYTAFAKNDPDVRVTIPLMFQYMFSATAGLTDLVVIGTQTVTSNAGDADYTTTQAAITALQVAVDALIVRSNATKNAFV